MKPHLDVVEIDNLLQSLVLCPSNSDEVGWMSPIPRQKSQKTGNSTISFPPNRVVGTQRLNANSLSSFSIKIKQELLVERVRLIEQLRFLLVSGSDSYLLHEQSTLEKKWKVSHFHNSVIQLQNQPTLDFPFDTETNVCNNCLSNVKSRKAASLKFLLEKYLLKSLDVQQSWSEFHFPMMLFELIS